MYYKKDRERGPKGTGQHHTAQEQITKRWKVFVQESLCGAGAWERWDGVQVIVTEVEHFQVLQLGDGGVTRAV